MLTTLVRAPAHEFISCGRQVLFKALCGGGGGGRSGHFLVQRFAPARLDTVTRIPRPLQAVQAATRLQGRAVNAPSPLACMVRPAGRERWQGLAVFQVPGESQPLHGWLAGLLTQQNDFGPVRDWMRAVGAAIADLHAAGVQHRRLDSWSIWVDPKRAPREGVFFTELAQCRIGAAPTRCQQLRDWATLELPPRLLEEAMIGATGDAKRYGQLSLRRLWRRGLRRWSRKNLPPLLSLHDVFLWDSTGDTAVDLRCRHSAAPLRECWAQCKSGHLPHDERLFAEAEPLGHRLTVVIRALAATLVSEIAMLGTHGMRDVWIRLCCHDAEARRAYSLATIQNLAKAGFAVSVMLVQDRRALAAPERWQRFVNDALGPVAWQVRRAVYGYALDEFAWGARSSAEYRAFLAPLAQLRAAFPGVMFDGPACAMTNHRFARRAHEAVAGAGGWETPAYRMPGAWLATAQLSDAAWLASLLKLCRRVGGLHRDMGRPLLLLEALPRRDMLPLNEEAEARYFRRLLLALCSGLVEQVVVSQPEMVAAARSTTASVWGRFMSRVGTAGRFVARERTAGGDTVWLLRFEDGGGAPLWLGWCAADSCIVTAQIRAERAYDIFGRNAPLLPVPRVRLTAMPTYFDSVGSTRPV